MICFLAIIIINSRENHQIRLSIISLLCDGRGREETDRRHNTMDGVAVESFSIDSIMYFGHFFFICSILIFIRYLLVFVCFKKYFINMYAFFAKQMIDMSLNTFR